MLRFHGTVLYKTVAAFIGGNAVQLNAEVAPEHAKCNTAFWTSSDERVATVDANGLVAPVAIDKTTMTATSRDAIGEKAT